MDLGDSVAWRRAFSPRVIATAVTALAALAASGMFVVPVPASLVIVAAAMAVIRWAHPTPVLPIVASAVLVSIAVRIPGLTGTTLAEGVLTGLLIALSVAGPALIVDVFRQRRAFTRRGWALADASARGRATAVAAALQRERMAVAAEMHDGLGHRLTLLAVQLGQLSLTPDLPEPVRASLDRSRATAAEAVDELGASVALLRQPGATTASAPPQLGAIIANARALGMDITEDIPDHLDRTLAPDAYAGAARVLQEALTNAAKHAPGTPVRVHVDVAADTLRLTVRNPADAPSAAEPGGFGLVSLRQRAAVLGGTFSARHTDGAFLVELELPVDAKPSHPPVDSDDTIVAAEREAAMTKRAHVTRNAVGASSAILAGIAVISVMFYVLSNIVSTLPRSDFAQIQAGQERAAVESRLPAWEMLDPPRGDVPARDGETCRYYESEVSFFDREDVFVICFVAGRVSRTEEVQAP